MVHLQLVQLEGFYLEWNKGLSGGEGYRNGNRVLEHFWGRSDTVGMFTWEGVVILATLESLGRYRDASKVVLIFAVVHLLLILFLRLVHMHLRKGVWT